MIIYEWQKILAVLLTAAMFLSAGSGVLAASADRKGASAPKVYAAGETSGSCGDAMNWSYNESTSVLTISGSGTMKSHPWSSFKGSIVKVVFSGNITSLCDSAFYECTNLSSVSIPDSVTEIGYSAFKGCKNLDRVTFGRNSSLNTLGKNYTNDGVFQNCVNLSEITLPDKLTAIQRETFSGCTNLERVTIGSGVKSIGAYAFSNCGNLTSVVVPNSVESAGDCIFRNCTNLSSVKLGSSLLTIGNAAFEGCSSLTDIVIPASVTEIGYSAFKNLKNLQNVVFESGSALTTLGKNYTNDGVFQNCTSIKSITLPNKLTAIQRDTFSGCSALEKITIGSSVKSVGAYAFSNCVNLKSVVVPNSVESLGDCSFKNCSNLTSIKLSNTLLTMGNSIFEGCSNLTGIVIPATVTDIGYSAFKNIKNLTNVTFEANSNLVNLGKNYNSDGVFQGCIGLKSIVIPDKVTTVNRDTFNGCTNLEKVTVGNHVVAINTYAFNGCIVLKEIVLPKALNTIESNAFKGCSALNTVKFTGTQARWNTLKNDGISATGNDYLLSAPKFVYEYSEELPTVSISASPSTTLSDGDVVTFKATATGTGLSYQWYYKKSAQTSWNVWNNRTAASTTATANSSWHGMQVRCTIKDSKGNSVSSNTLTLSVTAKLAITTQPTSVVVVADGGTVRFTVKATGTGTLQYQWYYKKASQNSWNIWKGRTTASTTSTANSTWDGMQVRCIVKDISGSVTSKTATIYIKKDLIITYNPSNVAVSDGQSVSFTVNATGTGVLRYQWYFKKAGGTWKAWNGHTTASTSATSNDTWNNMQVRCVVTDNNGSVTSSAATVTIAVPLKITANPQNVVVSTGNNATFTVKATGTGLKYQWYFKKAGGTWKVWNGRTTASTTATSNATWDEMQVRCLVTDVTGSKIYSEIATVYVM